MTEEQLQKGEFHVEEEMHRIQSESDSGVVKLSLVGKLPGKLKSAVTGSYSDKVEPWRTRTAVSLWAGQLWENGRSGQGLQHISQE